jgi:hypothetical protein
VFPEATQRDGEHREVTDVAHPVLAVLYDDPDGRIVPFPPINALCSSRHGTPAGRIRQSSGLRLGHSL